MKTRKLLLFALLLAATNIQAQVWIWPIAGQKTGANILSQPNTHIDKELNESDLFIGGKEGDAVVCPVDGIIEDISIVFIPKLFSVYAFVRTCKASSPTAAANPPSAMMI